MFCADCGSTNRTGPGQRPDIKETMGSIEAPTERAERKWCSTLCRNGYTGAAGATLVEYAGEALACYVQAAGRSRSGTIRRTEGTRWTPTELRNQRRHLSTPPIERSEEAQNITERGQHGQHRVAGTTPLAFAGRKHAMYKRRKKIPQRKMPTKNGRNAVGTTTKRRLRLRAATGPRNACIIVFVTVWRQTAR